MGRERGRAPVFVLFVLKANYNNAIILYDSTDGLF